MSLSLLDAEWRPSMGRFFYNFRFLLDTRDHSIMGFTVIQFMAQEKIGNCIENYNSSFEGSVVDWWYCVEVVSRYREVDF